MTTWVIEKDVFSESCFNSMVEHCKYKNIPYHVIRVVPFEYKIEGRVPNIEGPVVVYGSIGCQQVAKDNNWLPGVWHSDMFHEEYVSNTLRKDYLNNDGERMPISQVMNNVKMSTFFIKPASDTKEFAGMVIDKADFMSWYQKMLDIGYLDGNDFDVFVSEPTNIAKEWRLVIVNKKIVAFSLYKENGRQKVDNRIDGRAWVFASKVAFDFNPADVYVMDIGQTVNGYQVIEYNTFNSAGLYKCKVGDIIDSINRFIKSKSDT